MDAKKSKSANVETMRFPLMLMGVLFTGSIVLASFSYRSHLEDEKITSMNEVTTEISFLEEVIQKDKPEPTVEEEVVLPPEENIIIDSNKQKEPEVKIVIKPPDIKKGPDVIVPPEKIIEYPDVDATFPGGAAAMQQWISSNVQYPEAAIEMNEQGKVYLIFVVEKDGSISNVEILRSVSEDLDKEAKRLLRKMPKWEPGEAKGQKARTRCRLPINFTLN